MIPTITVFERSPDGGRGLARDMRVRWALEEVGQRYDVRLVSFSEMKEPAHRARHPFGQIPTLYLDFVPAARTGIPERSRDCFRPKTSSLRSRSACSFPSGAHLEAGRYSKTRSE